MIGLNSHEPKLLKVRGLIHKILKKDRQKPVTLFRKLKKGKNVFLVP